MNLRRAHAVLETNPPGSRTCHQHSHLGSNTFRPGIRERIPWTSLRYFFGESNVTELTRSAH
eukprot:5093748-Amphidinium_carterae.2